MHEPGEKEATGSMVDRAPIEAAALAREVLAKRARWALLLAIVGALLLTLKLPYDSLYDALVHPLLAGQDDDPVYFFLEAALAWGSLSASLAAIVLAFKAAGRANTLNRVLAMIAVALGLLELPAGWYWCVEHLGFYVSDMLVTLEMMKGL